MLNIDDRLLKETNAHELYLMLHIAKHMSIENNKAFPSLSTLCKVTGWTKPTVIKIKQQCIDKGLLSCEKQFTKSGGFASNIYTIETSHISLFINAKGRKAVEAVEEIPHEKDVKTSCLVNKIDKGSKGNLQGEVVNKIDKGSKNNLQALVKGFDTNKLVSLSINEFNELNTNNNIPKTDFDKSVLADLNIFDKIENSETTPTTTLEAEEKKEKKVPPKKEKKADDLKAKEADKAKQDAKNRSHLHSEFIEIYDKWHEGLKGERIPDVFWKQHVRAMASIREKFIPLSEQKLPTIGMEATDQNITKGFSTFLDNLKKSLTQHEVGKMTPRFLENNLLEFLEKVRNNHVNSNGRKSINNSQQQLVNKYFTGAGKATVEV